MSDNVKKRPVRRKPNGAADKHQVVLHHAAAGDADETTAAIAKMSREQVRSALREHGINPDEAVKRLKASLEETLQKLRRDHHPSSGLATPGGHQEPTGRGLIFAAAHAFPTVPWNATSFIAGSLRSATTTDAMIASIGAGFEHLGFAADALRIQCAVDSDAVWPLIECVYETAIVASVEPALWKSFARAHSGLASRMSLVHQCMLVHSVQEMLVAGIASPAFVTTLNNALSDATLSDEARVLLTRPSRAKATRKEDILSVTKKVAFLTSPVVDPLCSFSAMSLLSEAAASDSAASPVAEELIHWLSDKSASHFLTIGALARYRNRHPNRAALKMAAAAQSADERGRYALFLSTIKGYEHSFRGRRQAVVPQFELSGSPRFVPGDPHDLDAFGDLVCCSGAVHELRPQMQWANRRLAMWLSR